MHPDQLLRQTRDDSVLRGQPELTTSIPHALLATGARSIAAGGEHTCAVGLSAGGVGASAHAGVACWGENDWQQNEVPQLGAARPLQVAAGVAHSCLLLWDDGVGEAVRCWGWNIYNQCDVAEVNMSINLSQGKGKDKDVAQDIGIDIGIGIDASDGEKRESVGYRKWIEG
eukprot:Mrub_02823.p3 GENE.Mrub_02823~~Mrub_02823.p3  ORF type:complete len:171 (+),score=47.75 Mrub_02823:973-1485(+)